MIIANQEIAVHLKTVRNLTGYNSGRFALRISLEEYGSHKKVQATPVNIIEKEIQKVENRSESDDHFYISKTFPLKNGTSIDINEVCIFKINTPLFDNQDEDYCLSLTCQILQSEINKFRVVGVYNGKITGFSLHEYLQIDFYQTAACQIIGSIHSCLYKFEFKGEDNGLSLQTYCQKYCQFKVDQMLQYLDSQGKKSLASIIEGHNQIVNTQIKLQKLPPNKGIELKTVADIKNEKDVAERQTELTQVDEELIVKIALQANQKKKKRRRIFSTATRQIKAEKYQFYQRTLHENALNIYALWRDIVGVLLQQEGDAFIAQRTLAYRKTLQQKVGESIARFKGSWDVDPYCDEENLRAQMAHQLRNQDKQFFKNYKSTDHNLFPILNESFFSNKRPIFFEQKAVFSQNKSQVNQQQQIRPRPNQILIIMVHGLGACRLDMQKIKVELRRYYDTKFRVYVSSSNEGRTEGDIDSLGLRLAAQIQHQLSKYPQIPKLCLLGHSMGGLIIRSALPRLQKYKEHFHTFITLSSPHLGYAYSTSKLVDAGLWMINTMKKCTSILQMTMNDSEIMQDTFLFKLSKKIGLEWFKKIVLLASHQDLYVPYYSARIQKHEESLLDCRKNVKKGTIYCQMIDNLLSRYKGQIIRLNVNFSIPQQNIDNLIGRAAHISFINNVQMVRTFVLAGHHYFL